jgi:hypothetical protein
MGPNRKESQSRHFFRNVFWPYHGQNRRALGRRFPEFSAWPGAFYRSVPGHRKAECKSCFTIHPLPLLEQKSAFEEVSVLYGWRFTSRASSTSFSIGTSLNSFSEQVPDNANQTVIKKRRYAGVPFEANIKWFRAKKERFKMYGLFPVGRPTAFGGSFGFKLFGQVSRYCYAGLGAVIGLGFHKKYD